MKRKIISLAIILLGGQCVFAQASKTTELSLQKCVQMAVEKNINVKTARVDKEKGKAKKNEAQASLYPKIYMSASMTDNVALPTTLLPEAFGALAGTPGKAVAVQMGSNYSSTAMLTISQVLYNQTALTALKLAKKADEINELGIQKSKEEVGIQVARMYMLALTTLEQQKLIESNIENAERLKKITQVIVDNGVGKQIDLDRINVSLENTYTQLSNTKAAQEQQMNTIKYLLDMPLDTQIQLTDTVGTELLNNKPVLLNDFSSNVNIRMLESQKEIYSLNKKLVNAGYIPSLSLSGQAAYQGLQNKFSTYFSSGSDNKWFPYANFTVTLSVPVFDGFEKRSKARQVEMDTKKTELTLNNTKEALNLEYRNALNTYTNNKTNVSRQKQNLQLAENVYKETTLKYREGLAAMSSLLQDEMSLSSAQGGYLTALYNFKEAELKIMSLNGEIKNLINK